MEGKLSLDCFVCSEKGIYPKPFTICLNKSSTVGVLKTAISDTLNKNLDCIVCIIIAQIPKDTDLLNKFFKREVWPVYVYISKVPLSSSKTYGDQLPRNILDVLQKEYKGVELSGLHEKPSVSQSQANEQKQSFRNEKKSQSDLDDGTDDEEPKVEENDKEKKKGKRNNSGDNDHNKASQQQQKEEKKPTKPKAPAPPSSSGSFPKQDLKSKLDEIKPKAGEWECKDCTMINEDSTDTCSVCLTERPKNSNSNQSAKKLAVDMGDEVGFFPNENDFECEICNDPVPPGEGIILGCTHSFCRQCIISYLSDCPPQEMFKCPSNKKNENCDGTISHREAKEMLTAEQFQAFLAKEKNLTILLTLNENQCAVCRDHLKGSFVIKGNKVACSKCQSIYCVECAEVKSRNDTRHKCGKK